ncbi:MAG: hypothetical protein FWC57_03155 [Endomicrobia bacterium]|nr:hypothetical protein [Endomicrobiia bacterium]
MKRNISAVVFPVAVCAFFALSVCFVYLKQVRIEMLNEAGIITGVILKKQNMYFTQTGKFLEFGDTPSSSELGIDLSANVFFTLMKAEVYGDVLTVTITNTKGFFKGTRSVSKFDNKNGMTHYEVIEKSSIPLPRL